MKRAKHEMFACGEDETTFDSYIVRQKYEYVELGHCRPLVTM